ncbi:hypothetical protein AgCh_005492 [Apium graveolens]
MDFTKSLRRYEAPTDAGRRSPGPGLTRSKSGNTLALSLTEKPIVPVVHRSKSTTKSRTKAYPDHLMINAEPASTTTSSRNKKKLKADKDNNKDGTFVRFLQRNTHSDKIVQKNSNARLKPTSPSAWALSPARSSQFSPVTKTYSSSATTSPSAWGLSSAHSSPAFPVTHKTSTSSTTTSSMNGVLNYFKKKKVSSLQKLEYQHFLVLNNNLLQWRYANARAKAAMYAQQTIAHKKLYNVSVRILTMRNFILEKRVEMQKLKQANKVYQIIYSQDHLLRLWAKMEGKNSEAVGRVIRKLSAISIRVPLADDVKGDVFLVNDAMSKATKVMENVEETLLKKFDYQVERTCYLLTELLIIVKQQKEYLVELENSVSLIASLKAEEKSLRIQLIQLKEQ